MLDYLFRNASVIDGSGREAFPADVAVEDGRIEAVGSLRDGQAREQFDLGGRVLSPGFIDLHAHSDLALLENPAHLPKIMQGVTSEAFSSCGLGFAPLTPDSEKAVKTLYGPIFGSTKNIDWGWRSIADYMSRLDRTTTVNSAYHAAHGPIRLAVMGSDDREPTSAELDRMAGVVGEAMDAGAVGLSTGLAYPPMGFARRRELVALSGEVAKRGGLFSIHMRDYSDRIEAALEEAVSVCEESGARLQISHYMVWGSANVGRAETLLGWIEQARGRGVDIAFDAYPYTAGSTVVQMTLPDWAQQGGPDKLLSRLRDAATRECIIGDLRDDRRMDWSRSVIAGVKSSANERYVGMKFTAAAEAAGSGVYEFICRLLVEEDLEVSHIIHLGSEPDMRVMMRHAAHSFGSDGLHLEGRPHPRLYGCFPRVLGHYAREEKVLSLEQAVHKMTGRNAERLGLADRGVIAAGKSADLVVFDAETIIDRATYDEPRQYPEGIETVMVNGEIVVHQGSYSGRTPGRLLNAS